MPSRLEVAPAKVEGFLARIPFFAELDKNFLRGLASRSSVQQFELGETIFKVGERGDAFWIVIKGAVRVVAPEPDKDGLDVTLATLGPGEFFGDTAILEDVPQAWTARAAGEEKTLLVRIGRDIFEQLLSAQPALRERLRRLIELYRLRDFLKLGTKFGPELTPADLRAFMGVLELKRAKPGATVIADVDPDSPFLVVRTGSVNVVDARTSTSGAIGEGGHLGEQAIFAGKPSHLAVTAGEQGAQLVVVKRKALEQFLSQAPHIRDFLQANPCQPQGEHAKVSAPAMSISIDIPNPAVYLGLDATPIANAPPSGKVSFPAPTPRAPSISSADAPAVPKKKKPPLLRAIRFPWIRQHDATDCGAASLAMICRYYGKKVSLGRMRDLAAVSTEGATLQSIARAAESLGFVARGIKVKGDPVLRQPLPAIIHWGGFHYVVLYKIDSKTAWIADPAIGLRKLDRAEFDATFTGFMLTLETTERFDEVREAKTSFRRFLAHIRPFKVLIAEIAAASLLLDIFGLASPLFTQTIVDSVIPHQNERLLYVMLAGMLILAFFKIGTTALRRYLIANLSMRVDLRMLLKFYHHLLALPISFYKLRKTGDVMARFEENSKIRQILAGNTISTILDVLMVGAYLALMLYYNVKLTLAVVAFIPVFALLTLTFTPIMKRMNQGVFLANSEQQSHLVESVVGMETIKSLGVERSIRWRWENLFTKFLEKNYESQKVDTFLASVAEALSTLTTIVLLWYGATLVMTNEISVGQLMAFNALIGSVMTPISGLIGLWDQLNQAVVSMDRLNDILDSEPEEARSAAPLIDLTKLQGKIVFDRVFFRYAAAGEGAYILENLSFTIEPGSTVAIVGRSGSGKSTLAKLLLKLYLPNEGHISIDGLDITSVAARSLRPRIGVVPQEVFLFNGTIAENIAVGSDEVVQARVEEVAKLAEAHGFISTMALGYNTPVGERGLSLSGGQRQRIAIARALYLDPPILIFDEATSALDAESEAAIQGNLRRITAGRTSIIIAHRLSTVRSADKILVLDGGRLVEQGTHDELLGQKGLYHHLCSRQLEL